MQNARKCKHLHQISNTNVAWLQVAPTLPKQQVSVYVHFVCQIVSPSLVTKYSLDMNKK